MIDGLFELMCESVYRFGGWVAGFTGDGIKALFAQVRRSRCSSSWGANRDGDDSPREVRPPLAGYPMRSDAHAVPIQ